MIYFSLFWASFLSATLLPGSSEVMVIHMANNGSYSNLIIIFLATIGNTLGAFTNYAIGRWLKHLLENRFWGFSEKSLKKAEAFFEKRGSFALFLSFLPIIGDPLTAIAGVLEYPIGRFFLWVTIGKLFRYTSVVYLTKWIPQLF